MKAEPWQTAEIPGPSKSTVVSDQKRLGRVINCAKHPILVVGHDLAKLKETEPNLLQHLKKIFQATGIQTVATAPTLARELTEAGVRITATVPPIELADRLRDATWTGLDGEGPYDLAIFICIPYYFEWLLLSGLKHFAYKHLKTLTLDPYYQPQADFSLQNMPPKEWSKFMNEFVASLAAQKRGGK